MKIHYLNRDGVPRAEAQIHGEIERHFSKYQFSKNWVGYASFSLLENGGATDYDLLLFTHQHIISIELKNWHGRKLESSGGLWFLDRANRGGSPVVRTQNNVKKLAGYLRRRLGNIVPYIGACVVLHGSIDEVHLSEDERPYVWTKEKLFKLVDPEFYRKHFYNGRPTLAREYSKYHALFGKTDLVGKSYVVAGYRRDEISFFEHPKGLYKEFFGAKEKNFRALIRSWDFSRFDEFQLIENRISVALREENLYNYLEQNNPTLQSMIFRPVKGEQEGNIGLDFDEAFALRNDADPLRRFIHRRLSSRPLIERLHVADNILAKVQLFHESSISHNDLDIKNIWVDNSTNVFFSGFIQSYYPEVKGKNFSDISLIDYRSGCVDEEGPQFDQTKDVYALGLMLRALFADLFDSANEGVKTDVGQSILKIVEKIESERYESVIALRQDLGKILHSEETQPLLSVDDFAKYLEMPSVRGYDKQEIIEERADLLKYRSKNDAGDDLVIYEWYLPSKVGRLTDTEKMILLSFIRQLEALKSDSNGLCEIVEYGFDKPQRAFIVVLKDLSANHASLCSEEKDWRSEGVFKAMAQMVTIADKVSSSCGGCGRIASDRFFTDGKDVFYQFELQLSFDSDVHDSVDVSDDVRKLCGVIEEFLGKPNVRSCLRREDVSKISSSIKDIRKAPSTPNFEPLINLFDQFLEFKAPKNEFHPIEIEDLYFRVWSRITDWSGVREFRPFKEGYYRFKVVPDKNYSEALHFYITGRDGQIQASFFRSGFAKPTVYFTEEYTGSPLDWVNISCQIHLQDEQWPDLMGATLETLMNHPVLGQYIEEGFARAKEGGKKVSGDSLKRVLSSVVNRPVGVIWKALIDAEIEVIPKYTIRAVNPLTKDTFEIELDSEFDFSDKASEDNLSVEVEEGAFYKNGGIVPNDSKLKGNILEVCPDDQWMPEEEDVIRIRSKFEKSSLDLRLRAMKEFMSGRFKIKDFDDYFEAKGQKQAEHDEVVVDEDLLKSFDFNLDQENAFKKILQTKPISLLQGPPGTGKTRFIASFMLYLLKKQPDVKILLTSQSNEAVNNAIEKLESLCLGRGVDLSLVRIGRKEKVSDSVMWYQADCMTERFRQTFLKNSENRVRLLSNAIGLPLAFSKEIYSIYSALWRLGSEVKEKEEDTKEEGNVAKRRALYYRLASKFADMTIAESDCSVDEAFDWVIETAVERHGINDPKAVQDLKNVLEISIEFEEGLTASDSQFSEFLVRTKNIVAGTLVGLGGRKLRLKENDFDWIIIDEASRATASELAIACQSGKRILLVGDHKQLPPSYTDELIAKFKEILNIDGDVRSWLISDFERIFTSNYGIENGCLLGTQYRMDPVIGEMVSTCFYEGKLTTGRTSRSDTFVSLLPQRLQGSSLIWYDTSSDPSMGKEKLANQRTYCNINEAEAIVKLLEELFENEKFVDEVSRIADPVGVICMYSGQRDVIKKLIAGNRNLAAFVKKIKVDTVDSYQGKENKIILLSTVRQNSQMKTGFLKLANRVNVALSRAQDVLVVFGSRSLWGARDKEPLGRVLGYMLKNGMSPKPLTELLK